MRASLKVLKENGVPLSDALWGGTTRTRECLEMIVDIGEGGNSV